MQFKPKSEKEIQEAQLWPKGEYDFEVVGAEAAKSGPNSKNPGTDFIKLNVKVFNAAGGFRFVKGMLHPSMEAQLRHFCVAGKLESKYEAGTLSHQDCVGVVGRLKLKIKEEDGDFPAKNEIADYVVKKTAPVDSSGGAAPENDDVPF